MLQAQLEDYDSDDLADDFRSRFATGEVILEKIAEIGPCQGCAKSVRCTAERLACVAFGLFVRHGGARWKLAPRQPSRELFREIFPA
jgi:hypothetical protein